MSCFYNSAVVALLSLTFSTVSSFMVVGDEKLHHLHHVKHTALFNYFLEQHNKTYATLVEYYSRLHIFSGNLKKIQLLQDTEHGSGVYGLNEFSDLSTAEFQAKYLGFKLKPSYADRSVPAMIPNITLPRAFDWREYDAVTGVKDQTMCGSSWAFSTTGNIEGVYAAKTKKLVSLSEQELIDCDQEDDGCEGGSISNAFDTIMSKLGGGLEEEKTYPYRGDDKACRLNKKATQVKINGYVSVSRDETDMAKYLVENGPMAVAINAYALQFYVTGVSHPIQFFCDGGNENLSHSVLIVGYGVDRTKFTHKAVPYWIIKNSWGEGWGEKGYFRLYRGDGSCGINDYVRSALV